MTPTHQSPSRRLLHSATDLPVFQNCTFITREEARSCVRGNINLVQDTSTGLVFNESFLPELIKYGSDYQNEQALSDVFKAHLEDVSRIVADHFHDRVLIEVGCGKGYFLERLLGKGFDITGMDPVYEGSNSRILKEYFTPESGRRADGIIMRHVLEHVEEPVSFLEMIREANGGRGRIYIEVPCFDWICERRAWFDIFYEHVNYFRLTDFERMFGTIYEIGRLFRGQYIYVVADLASLRTPVATPSSAIAFPHDFGGRVAEHAAFIKAASGRRSVVWGGASKGVIFSLMMQRAGAEVDFVVDINPAKQGRYIPVTGLKIYSPKEAMDQLTPRTDVFVMNENYLAEIKSLTQDRYSYISVDGTES